MFLLRFLPFAFLLFISLDLTVDKLDNSTLIPGNIIHVVFPHSTNYNLLSL